MLQLNHADYLGARSLDVLRGASTH